jgi:predicted dehydrogenase
MLKAGVIGGNMQLRAALVEPNLPKDKAEVVAIVDRDPIMRDRYRAAHPGTTVQLLETYQELLAMQEIDVVFIMVRDCYHEEMACAALEAGKAVYLEKPMAISIEGCDHILETAYRTRQKLFLGHNMRYMPFVQKMKEIIDSGVIGPIQAVWVRHFINYGSCYFRHWCAERANVNGLLLQKGAHDIDVIHWLAGGYAKRVVAMGKLSVYNTCKPLAAGERPDRQISFTPECWPPGAVAGVARKIDVEDHNMILMQLDNGVQASLAECMYAPDADRNYTFIGTRGRIENIGSDGGSDIHVWVNRGKRTEPDVVYHIRPGQGSHGGSDVNIVASFIDFVRGVAEPLTSPVAARQAVAAGVLGHQSMRNGNQPFDVPPLNPAWTDYFDHGQRTGI